MLTNYLIFLLLLWIFVFIFEKLTYMHNVLVTSMTLIYLINDIDNTIATDTIVKLCFMLSYLLLSLEIYYHTYIKK